MDSFLKIDQDAESEQQENTLRGIRKSQVKLAIDHLQRKLISFFNQRF